MIIPQFFYLLVTIWLPHEKYLAASRDAFEFYCWLLKLKRTAFLPGQDQKQRINRLECLRKCVSKMPTLTPAFYDALHQLNAVALSHLPKSDSVMMMEKKNRVSSLIDFLITIDDSQVVILRKMLYGNTYIIKTKQKQKNQTLSRPHDNTSQHNS